MNSPARESVALRVQAEQIADAYLPTNGRPSHLQNADTVQQLLAAIQDGNYMETACHLVGLSKVTVYNWLKRGEAGEEPHATFRNALLKAEAVAESEMVHNVRQASKLPQFWPAGMTYLERKFPDRWGKRQDDSSVPKVVVQIGVQASDVHVQVLPSPSLSPDFHGLSAEPIADG